MNDDLLLTLFVSVSSIATFILGVVVLINNSRRYQNISFFGITTGFALWAILTYIHKLKGDILTARLIFISLPLILISLLIFSRHFPVNKKKLFSQSWHIWVCIMISILLLFIGMSPLVIVDIIKKNGKLIPVSGNMLLPYYFISGLIAVRAVIKLARNYILSKKASKLKMQYLLFGIIIMFTGMIILSIIVPFITGSYNTAFYAPSLSIILVLCTFYSIIKYRLWSIKFIIGKSFYYFLTAIITYTFFFFIFIIQTKLWGSIVSHEALISGGVIAILYILIFKKVDVKIRNILDKLLIYSEYNPFEIINNLLKVTSTELSMEKVVLNVLSLAKNVFNSDKAGLVLFDRDNRKILYKKLIGFDKKAHRNMRDLLEVVNFWDLQEQAGDKSEILVFEELVQEGERLYEEERRLTKIMNFMKEDHIAVLLPLNRKVQLNGLLLIGKKENEDAYTVQDINLLESIVANASVAVGRALLYDQVERSADILQQKVDQATKQLRAKIVALEEARRKERDMIDILGHELRTPMSIIKNGFGYMQMMYDSNIKDKIDKKTRTKVEKYNDRIFENIDREIQLINTLLSSTKIDTGKVELSRESVDIIDVVEDGIVGQKNDARKQALYLKFNKPSDWKKYPKVYADRARIQEVMDNIISNAVKYTEKGGVTIDIEHDDDFVTIHVIDTGIGIPKNELNNLGKKFYRVKQYTEGSKKRELKIVRAGGSGLGLYVTFGLVKAHGGKIWLESRLEKGTVFHFTVPVYKRQEQGKRQEVNKEKDVFKRVKVK